MPDQIIYNPIFGDSICFLKTPSETNNTFAEHELTVKPSGRVPAHYHRAFTEKFTAVQGELGVKVNGKIIILRPGESLTVQKNEVHNFFNPSDKTIVFRVRHTPGLQGSEDMLRIMYGLARDGKTNKKGIPKNLYHVALIADMGGSRVVGPLALMSPVFKYLAKRARKMGIEKELLNRYCR